jgi:sensor c-di-GMP phosphodiesterase-like protein
MAEGGMSESPEVIALAHAQHEHHHFYEMPAVAFADCAYREWDIKHAAEVIESLRALGYRVSVDPVGTLPLPLAVVI